MLLVAATVCATEFEVSRSYSLSLMEGHILKMFIAANEQITGYWQGGQLGIISSLYKDAKAYGVTFEGTLALHEGWGLNPATDS